MTSETDVLKSTHEGVLTIGNLEIPAFVLEDETRLISGRGMTKAVGTGPYSLRDFANRSYLQPFMSDELREAITHPIVFRRRKGGLTHGHPATCLLQLCEALLAARDAGVLNHSLVGLRYAKQAEILVRAFATVGIVALVDEATGFQEDRKRKALHELLEKFISRELLPWERRFPPEFYKHVFRLYGWPYDPASVKRPSYVGKFTKEFVYKHLPPGVLPELERRNPVDDRGRRRHKHHQLLTTDIGNPALEKQVFAVMALMRASSNIGKFKRLFARSFPEPEPIEVEATVVGSSSEPTE